MTTATEIPRLKVRYNEQIRDQLKESLALGNIMEVPRLEKIVINMGVGGAVAQASLLENAVRDLTAIAGQKPQVTRAAVHAANVVDLRAGDGLPIGDDGQGLELRPR